MGLETATYIDGLVVTNPLGTDAKSQGDDHLRLIKTTAKNTFPGFVGVVIATGVESGSSNAYTITLSPAPASYTPLAASVVVFKATHANSGAATLQVNALGTKALKAVDGSALESGDIESGAVVAAFYDGTDFLLISANDRAARNGDTYTGTHDFTGATINVPTASPGDADTSAASTAFVDASFGKFAGQAYTGTHDFTGADTQVVTAAPGTNDETAASTAFATQLAFQATLPVQTAPAVLYSDGSAASWRAAFVGDGGSGGELGPVPAPASGDAAKYLRGDGVWHLAPSAPDVIIQDQKTSGTDGSVFGVGWNTRTLNTVVRNVGSIASLASSVVTLPAGTWMLRARAAVGNGSASGLSSFATRIRNTTDGATLARSEPVRLADAATVGFTQGASQGALCVVTLAAPKAIEVQTYSVSASSTGGAATSTGEPEVYLTFEATLLST